jgi:cold shock CspA family protein
LNPRANEHRWVDHGWGSGGAYTLVNGKRSRPSEWPEPVTDASVVATEGEWQTGSVRRLLTDGQRGFLVPDGAGRSQDLLFHMQRLNLHGLSLAIGQRVRFTTAEDPQTGRRMVKRLELIEEGLSS